MTAQIPHGIASMLLKELGDLRAKVVPLVEHVLHQASSAGTDVAEDAVQRILDEFKSRTAVVETKIKEYAPPGA